MNATTETRAATRRRLAEHGAAYPALRAEDLFKFLYQSAFGCEHLVADSAAALRYVLREAEAVPEDAAPRLDRLDGDYSRVHLSWLREGLSPETLTRLFCLSAKTEEGGDERLREGLSVAREMVAEGALPVDAAEFDEKHRLWAEAGYPALHHSEAFREAYRPSYRVVANRYAEHLPLLAAIDRLLAERSAVGGVTVGATVVAATVVAVIEGGSANGKTTLGEVLCQIYDCNLIHTDDFFLRPEQRTSERLAEVGGNLDRERFHREVVAPLCRGEAVCYAPFDCQAQALGAPVTLPPKPLTVVEGVYAMHPFFGRYYDLSVFLEVSAEVQRARILRRNSPTFARRFFEEWIPKENAYFDQMSIRQRADLRYGGWEG